jgi:uncharacterized protein (TIGR00369 family)
MRELPHTRSCFVCGETNPLGLRQRFATDGRLVRAEFAPRPEHCGFSGVVHGGVLATVLDEIMVWACAVGARQFAFCAEMTTRFHHPAQPGEMLQVEAELVANRRGKIFEARALVRNAAGQLAATATGKYMPIRAADLAELQRDVVGDLGWVLNADT